MISSARCNMNINGLQQEIELLLGVISTVYRNHDNISPCLAAEFRAAPQPSKQCGPSGEETSSVRFPAKMMNVLELKTAFPESMHHQYPALCISTSLIFVQTGWIS